MNTKARTFPIPQAEMGFTVPTFMDVDYGKPGLIHLTRSRIRMDLTSILVRHTIEELLKNGSKKLSVANLTQYSKLNMEIRDLLENTGKPTSSRKAEQQP